MHCYSEEHHHNGIQFITPAERHSGAKHMILAKRKAVYEAAKRCHPGRWSGENRNWSHIGEVWLNPENLTAVSNEIREKAALETRQPS